MIKKTLKQISELIECEVADSFESVEISGVQIDTRKIQTGNLFVPLKGANSDGHAFVEAAIEAGAAASFWERTVPNPPNIPLIFVDDALVALQKLSAGYLKLMSATVIGVTGSNGKTTTKDILASVLGQAYTVHKTDGNFNNHIGMPLTILASPQNVEMLILEMGMSARGEISFLSNLAKPNVAIISNIGESHMLDLGSRKGIAEAKFEIAEGLCDGGKLFYNGDEPLLTEVVKDVEFTSTFGRDDESEFYPTKVSMDANGTKFTVRGRDLFIPILGRHNIVNALAAVAVACEFDMEWEDIRQGLAKVRLTKMRGEMLDGVNGSAIINDAYNASPTSMRAAVELAQDLQGFDKKYLVLGDMLELGADEVKYHFEIGQFIKPELIDYVYTYGNLGKEIANGANVNFPKDRVKHLMDKEELTAQLKGNLKENDLVLFKASRGMRLEEIANQLLDSSEGH